MSRRFLTADTHFGHTRVSVNRGFATTEEHDQHLIDKMCSVLTKRDHTVFLGDLTIGNPRYALELVASLPGTKSLITGNHDLVHPMHRTATGPNLRMYLEVFETVQPFARRQVDGVEYALSHFPYPSWGDGEGEENDGRHLRWRLPESDYPLAHGHTHGTEREHGAMLHVGWDSWGELVPEQKVLNWVRARKAEKEAA